MFWGDDNAPLHDKPMAVRPRYDDDFMRYHSQPRGLCPSLGCDRADDVILTCGHDSL